MTDHALRKLIADLRRRRDHIDRIVRDLEQLARTEPWGVGQSQPEVTSEQPASSSAGQNA